MKKILFVLSLLFLFGCTNESTEPVSATFSESNGIVTAIVNINLKESSSIEIKLLDENKYTMISKDETKYELEKGKYKFTLNYEEMNEESNYNLLIYINAEEYSFDYPNN